MKHNYILFGILFGVSTLFLGWVLVAQMIVPYRQMSGYLALVKNGIRGDASAYADIPKHPEFFTPYTYIQPELRGDLLSRAVVLQDEGRGAESKVFLPFAIQKVEETIGTQNEQVKYLIALGRSYVYLAGQFPQQTEKALALSMKYYQRALTLWPGSYQASYGYAVALSSAGRHDEARAIISDIIAYDPEVSLSYYYRGYMAYKQGTDYYAAALADFERIFDDNAATDQRFLGGIYVNFFKYFYKVRDIERFSTVVDRLIVLDPDQSVSYTTVKDYIARTNRLPTITIE